MSNAKWMGGRLRDMLDRVGIKPSTVATQFNDLDEPVVKGAPVPLHGIALGRDCGVMRVDTSVDGGATWQPAALKRDGGCLRLSPMVRTGQAPVSSSMTAMVRCTNAQAAVQPAVAN